MIKGWRYTSLQDILLCWSNVKHLSMKSFASIEMLIPVKDGGFLNLSYIVEELP